MRLFLFYEARILNDMTIEQNQVDPIKNTEIINQFDDKSMIERISSLSSENLKVIDHALNAEGIPGIGICNNIMTSASESERKMIAELLSDFRMVIGDKEKGIAAKAFAKYINSL